MPLKSLSGICPMCNHSVDRHRLKIHNDGVIRVRCVTRSLNPETHYYDKYCNCNCGFNTQVKYSTIMKEEKLK